MKYSDLEQAALLLKKAAIALHIKDAQNRDSNTVI